MSDVEVMRTRDCVQNVDVLGNAGERIDLRRSARIGSSFVFTHCWAALQHSFYRERRTQPSQAVWPLREKEFEEKSDGRGLMVETKQRLSHSTD